MPSSLTRAFCATVAALAVGVYGAGTLQAEQVDRAEARLIASEAYVYLYPLVLMDVTRQAMTSRSEGQATACASENALAHCRAFPDASFRKIVRPNFDTLYSSLWMDLSNGPLLFSMPDTEGRYFVLQMMDLWTDAFAAPGKRTTGTGAALYAIVPPGWTGELPAGAVRIDSPTKKAWMLGRIQTNGPADYPFVRKLQDGMKLSPLNPDAPKPEAKSALAADTKTEPPFQVKRMPAEKFFARAMELMKDNPPHPTDWSILARMKRIGMEPGKPFELAKLPPEVQEAVESAPEEGFKEMKAKQPNLAKKVNGWQMNTDTVGVYGNFYVKRALVALMGIGANQPEDAIYPICAVDAAGAQLEGGASYVLHFAKGELPPAGAFWSVTMYDFEGFPVPNALNRYALGDRDALKFNDDGSLDLWLQPSDPGEDRRANWLPSASAGRLGVTMRLYAPKPQALDGRWAPPAVRKIEPKG